MVEQLLNWRIALDFRLGANSFVCKDIKENEDFLRDEREAFQHSGKTSPTGHFRFSTVGISTSTKCKTTS